MTRTVTIDGKAVSLRATAALPRLYRAAYNRDFFRDVDRMSAGKKGGSLPLETIENLAYLMARSADPAHIPGDITDWLDTIEDPTAIFNIAGDVIELYLANLKTDSVPKKKNARLTAP